MIPIFAFTALLVLALIVACVVLVTRVNDLTQQVERLRRALYPVSLRGNWRKDGGRNGAYSWHGKSDAMTLRAYAERSLDGWSPYKEVK